jgi:hypothetical protein
MSDRYQPPSTPPPGARPKKPLGILRGITAAVGIIIMVLSGGCALLVSGAGGGLNLSDLTLVSIYAGPPFLIGLGIWWLAVKVGR